nr:hypothetical protein [Parabacteroides goldsteinii]
MTPSGKPDGLLRTTYETSIARLDNFPAMESDWCELLTRLTKANSDIRYCNEEGREEAIASLWVNHVLTVLVDIARQATSTDTESLQREAGEWIVRLDHYINRNWKIGNSEISAVKAARQLKERLEKSLSERILRTIRDIREHFDYYLSQIEDSGDMDAALSLLIIYLRNYGGIAQTFNRHLDTLTELYHHDILHAVPQETVQDNAYIVITPTGNTLGFTLPAGDLFPAGENATGEELFYRTTQKEYISPILCAGVNAVYLRRGEQNNVTAIRRQSLSFKDTDTIEKLFADEYSQALPLGWQVESPMLVLNEGERNISIRFCLTDDSIVPDRLSAASFILQFSSAEGWIEPVRIWFANLRRPMDPTESTDSVPRLYFDFTIAQDAAAPIPCNEETHGLTTEYPVVRILTNEAYCPYDWATRLNFDAIEIRTEVTGIHNFTFCNELGTVDTSQPFQPFGLQAGREAWFLFGNEEMGLKPLQEVSLKGLWKKLPETKAAFDQIYKDYGSNADAFKIKTEWQKGGKWNKCDGEQNLFTFDGENKFNPVEIVFRMASNKIHIHSGATLYEYDRDYNGFFRATLDAPSIGFGLDAYRTLFTETLLHNSRCKEKKRKAMPLEPVIPLLADAELSYIALETTSTKGNENPSIRLSRITALPEPEPFSIKKESPVLPAAPADNMLYFAFLHAQGERAIRMYLDMVLPSSKKLPDEQPSTEAVNLAWEYWNGNSWQSVSSDSVRAEETSGLTQSGFIEIKLPEKINGNHIDKQGRIWLRVVLTGNVSSCLAIRNIWMNCIRLTAVNGDGMPLSAGTIQFRIEADERIESIIQPLNGFGGRQAEVEAGIAVHQVSRIHNRHRAITIQDYEQLVLEHFPEVDKVQCLAIPPKNVRLVIFSRADDNRYYLSPAWKLTEIERFIGQYVSPFVCLKVVNPSYKKVFIKCKAVLWPKVKDEGKTLRQLVVLAQNYIEPWYRKGEIPITGQQFSYKELHARMANHEDLMKLVSLEVDGESLPYVNIDTEDIIIQSDNPTDVLIPIVTIELLSSRDGIGHAEIESNFIIS